MNITNNLGTLQEIIERITGRDLEAKSKLHEDVVARTMFYGIGKDLFNYKDTQLAEFISKNRLSAYHCRTKIYDRFERYDKPNWELRNYIVAELDRELGKENKEYLRSDLRQFNKDLAKLPPEIAEKAVEKIGRTIEAYINYYVKEDENK